MTELSSMSENRSDLRRSVCQVLDSSGACVGTAFLVDGGLLVSCAHVIASSTGSDDPKDAPAVSVRFPHVGKKIWMAEVMAGYWHGPDDGDVAVVRLLEPPPEQASPLRLAEGALPDRQVKAYGFPVNAPTRGHYGRGTIGDRLTSDTGHPLVQLHDSHEMTEGFSGAPVTDARTGLVMGMVDSVAAPDRLRRGTTTTYVTPAERLRELIPVLSASDRCPYQGLAPFGPEDTAWFFGRDGAIKGVLERLAADGTPRLAALLGPSGSGKTSLIQAGVLPALAAGDVPGSRRWITMTARPGGDPFAELEATGLPGTEDDMAEAVGRWFSGRPDVDRLVLVLDPFEELFGASTSPTSRRRLLDDLSTLPDRQPRATVLLVMRDDFYSRLAASAPLLMGHLERRLINMPATLGRNELTLMISEPAAGAGVAFEPGLVDHIIDDAVASTPAEVAENVARIDTAPTTVLPLLEFALSELWVKRMQGELTRDGYAKIGFLTGALASRCDHIFEELPPDHRDVGRRFLTELVEDPAEPDLEVPLTRRRRRRSQLPGPLRDDPKLSQVVAKLAEGRLIVTGRDALTNEPTYDLIHDSLIRHWDRLRAWLESDRVFRLWRSRVDTNYREWADSASQAGATPDPEQLLRGGAVAIAQQQLSERRVDLPDHLVRYIEDSARAERRRRSRSRRLRRTMGGVSVFLVMLFLGAWILYQQREVAREGRQVAQGQERLANSRKVAADAGALHSSRPDLSMLLAVEAMRIAETVEARGALLTEQAQRYGGSVDVGTGVFALAISPDGRSLVTGGVGKGVKVWDAASHTPIATLPYSGTVDSVAFSADGSVLAGAGDGGKVQLWDAGNAYAQTATLTVPSRGVSDIAFSADGKTIAIAGQEGTVHVVTVPTGVLIKTITAYPGEFTGEVVFSPTDSNVFATVGGHQTVKLWDTRTDAPVASFPGNTDPVYSTALAFSPDGTTIATASTNHTVKLWSTKTRAFVATLDGHANGVDAVAFRPDGQMVATASGGDHSIVLWDARTGTFLDRLPRQADSVSMVAFSGDGVLATTSMDGPVRLWTTQGPILAGPFRVMQSIFSPDGQTLATAYSGGSVELWDARSHRSKKTLAAPDPAKGQVGGNVEVAFSPDSSILSTVGGQSARLWNVQDGTLLADVLIPDVEFLLSTAFSPDGRTVAVSGQPGSISFLDVPNRRIRASLGRQSDFAGYDHLAYRSNTQLFVSTGGSIELLDLSANRSVGTFEPAKPGGGGANNLALSPDGKLLAAGYSDGSILLWDVETQRPFDPQLAKLGSHTGRINGLAFSPDSQTLATAGDDRTVKLWDVGGGTLSATLAAHAAPVLGVSFRGDGTLVSAGADAVTIVWDLDPGRVAQGICASLRMDLSPDDWERYIPQMRYRPICTS
jgi:WD40 repeat protein